MSRRGWLAAALVVVLLGGSGPAAAQDKPYVWKEGKIEIQFPGEPKESKGQLQLAKDTEKTAYFVMFNEIPGLSKTPPDGQTLIFNNTRASILKSLNGKLLSEKE